MSDLRIEITEGVACLTLDRAHEANAFGGTLMRDLLEASRELQRDDRVRAIVTAAEGPAWCVGARLEDLATASALDVDSLLHGTEVGGAKGLPPMTETDRALDRLGIGRWTLGFLELEKPLIAAVNGPVAGGGLALLLLHDLCIASPRARFACGFTTIGVGPEMGLSWFLPRIVGQRAAAQLMLTNAPLDARRAFELGLVSELIDDSDVVEAALRRAAQIAALPPLGVRATISALRASAANGLITQLELEWANQRPAFASDDVRAAVAAVQRRVGGR